jgi:hypothetical protein
MKDTELKSLKEKFEKEIMSSPWDSFTEHLRRDALLIIDNGLALTDAAISVASDNAQEIESYLSKSQVRKPTEEDIQNFGKSNPDFSFLIIQPFILLQISV